MEQAKRAGAVKWSKMKRWHVLKLIGPHTMRQLCDLVQEQYADQPRDADHHLRPGRDTLELTDETAGAVDGQLEQLELALVVRQALERLPEPCRDILDRFFCREQPYAVIGAELGIAAGTIASRISRCLARLRASLEGRQPAQPPSERR